MQGPRNTRGVHSMQGLRNTKDVPKAILDRQELVEGGAIHKIELQPF
jgi:hypothetical protein